MTQAVSPRERRAHRQEVGDDAQGRGRLEVAVLAEPVVDVDHEHLPAAAATEHERNRERGEHGGEDQHGAHGERRRRHGHQDIARHARGAAAELAGGLEEVLVHAAKRTQQQERGQAEVLPGQGDGDPGPRRREAGEVRAPDNTERMTHDHKRHEQRHLQQELDGAEGPRAQPSAERDGRGEGQDRPRGRDAQRVEHVTGVEPPDRPVVRERPLAVAREARDERDAHRPHEHAPEDGQGRTARDGPEDALALCYRTISS